MNWFKRIFTGSTFWLLNSIINFFLSVFGLFLNADTTLPFLTMWISLATYEVLKHLEEKKEESDAV